MIRSDNTVTVYKSRRGGVQKSSTLRLGTAALAAFCAAVFAIFVTACPNAAGGGSGGYAPAAAGSFEDAGAYVKIIPPAKGIIGTAPDYTLLGSEDWWKGVFIKDRTVTLSPYMLGKTEVTYELWYEVLKWNTDNSKGYIFANQGKEGSAGTVGAEPTDAGKTEPVTMVSWRDCIVWCNAYTEMVKGSDAECIYRKSSSDPTVLKNANDTDSCDAAYADMAKKGYRLPTEAEWEYAARWQGTDKTNAQQYGDVCLTKLDSASGAKDKYDTAETGEVAWYYGNAGEKTHPVGEKRANYLGLEDMSGNVWEWCFDWYGNITAGSQTDPQGAGGGTFRVARGGGWYGGAIDCAVGSRGGVSPVNWNDYLGFRLACRP